MSWNEDQKFERAFWADCSNSFTEETKQLTYAYKMGLACYSNSGKWPCYDLGGKSVLDIGGGPVSMLLKCENRGRALVIDPCKYPSWIAARYEAAGIDYIRAKGEDVTWGQTNYGPSEVFQWDEAWIYNVLQHTEDPELIIQNARNSAPIVRIFEWIDFPAHEGHPHELKEDTMNKWLDGVGDTEHLSENGCYGRAYFGVFSS